MSKLFEKATSNPRRLKMYIYGETGTGKTITSLHMPDPAVIDTEGGTNFYGKFFDFDRIQTSDYYEIFKTVTELLKDPKGYKTLVIDPFSNVWDKMVNDYEKYLRKKKGEPHYTITGLDYRPLKSNIKRLVQHLNDLDMNIVITARSKAKYSNDGDDFMKVEGTKPDGPKGMEYMFDVVLELVTENEGEEDEKRWAIVKKDRTNTLPKKFEFNYEELSGYFGIEDLERETVTFDTEKKNRSGRNQTVEFEGKDVQTAGVNSSQLKVLKTEIQKMPKDELKQKLHLDYGVESMFDLREDEAELLIKDLKGQTTKE